MPPAPAVAAAVGTAAGAVAAAAVARASTGPTLVAWPDRVRAAFPLVTGAIAGLGAGITAASVTGAAVSVVAGSATPRRISPGASLTGAGALALAAVGGALVVRTALARIAEQGRSLDAAFADPPPSSSVSGGPGSALSMTELGREGARFVWSRAGDADAKAVVGKKLRKEPVRVFVGFDAAATPEQRVGLAMAELRRTGALDRAILVIEVPAGTGYANPTPVDVVEILGRGDTAAVSVAYGVLPSFLSLREVPLAAHTQTLLLEAVAAELRERPRRKRPRVLLYGESLGAKVAQAAIPAGPADLDRFGIDTALFVGTPGGATSDAFHAACRDVSWTVDRPEQLPAHGAVPVPRPRTWFLEHDGDPVVRFRPELLTERPSWLPTDGTRGRNVPDSMRWRPGVTWAQVLVDTLFATNVRPGDFQSLGHDYRADLGPVAATAFDLLPEDPDEAARVLRALDERLRAIEIERARRIEEAPAEKTDLSGIASPTP